MMYEARWEEKEKEIRMNTRCSFRRTVPTLSWRPVAVTITLSVHLQLAFINEHGQLPAKSMEEAHRISAPLYRGLRTCVNLC